MLTGREVDKPNNSSIFASISEIPKPQLGEGMNFFFEKRSKTFIIRVFYLAFKSLRLWILNNFEISQKVSRN